METLIGVVRESEDLIVSGVDARSLAALVDYAAAMLTWRDGVWAQLTPCAEAIHLGMLMSQTASDIVTAFAFSFAGVPAAENPFGELLSEELTELGVTLEALIVLTSAAGDASVAAPLENRCRPARRMIWRPSQTGSRQSAIWGKKHCQWNRQRICSFTSAR